MKETRQFFAGGGVVAWSLVFLVGAAVIACAPAPDVSPQDPGGGSGGKPGTGGKPAGGSGGSGNPGGGGSSGGQTGSGGQPAGGSGGNSAQGGAVGSGGATGGSGSGGAGNTGSGGNAQVDSGGGASGGSGGVSDAGGSDNSKFSFFVVSMKALQTLSGKPAGFGGDLRFGKADGLAGADEICRQAAEMALPGAGKKNWRAYLSSSGGGTPIHARDRIGKGPWYDRKDRLLAMNLTDLFSGDRPKGDPQLVSDFTNERGEPNHYVGANGFTPGSAVDNHDTLTGSTAQGMLSGFTCNDWTSATAVGRPMCGHSWPRSANSGRQWSADHSAPGCVPGLDRTLGGSGAGSCVGCSGGYGGFYCFVAN
jgi:hypothetical protein